MYKLFIVDDEDLVIEGLMENIRWNELDVEVVGSANNGAAALDMILDKKPQIVITDIRMPKKNGLELIQEVKSHNSETVFIIFSGYSEFEYAKKAMQLETVDYLIKPVELDEITAAVKKAIEKYERSLSHDKSEEIESLKIMAKDNLIGNIVLGGQTYEEIKFEKFIGTVIIAGFKESIAIMKDFKNKIGKCFEDDKIEVYIKAVNLDIVMTIFSYEEDNEALITELNDSLFKKLDKLFYEEYRERPYYGIGSLCSDLSALHKSYTDGISALEFGFYLDKSVCKYDEAVYSDILPQNTNWAYIKDKILFGENFDEIEGDILDFVKKVAEVKLNPDRFKKICEEFVYNISINLEKEYHIDFERLQGDRLLFNPINSARMSIYDIYERFIETLKVIQRNIALKRINYKGKLIDDIKTYIKENLAEDLTLAKVADQAHMSLNYISSFFKKETGYTIIDYLTLLRIERAKELLKGTNLRINEISKQVGYENQRYFCQVFKKTTGQTAKAYRDSVLKL